jgi:hypothetical protein
MPPRSGARTAVHGLLAIAATGFVLISLNRSLPLDPARSLVPLPPRIFPLLVGHVVFGALAMLTAFLQVLPARARWSPAAHRVVGRIYVFGAVLPAGLLALVVACFSPFGPVARASNLLFATVWIGVTLAGWRAGKLGLAAAHRRWMIRSGVLTFSILTNRVWGPIAFLLLAPERSTSFHDDEAFFAWTIAGLSTWLGWTLPLLATELVLELELERAGRSGDVALRAGRAQR